jgi:hypothetical protein
MTSRRIAVTIAVLLVLTVIWVDASRGADARYLIRGFQCIHKWEGAWTANTGNGYYGGLQMDMTFQRTYGAEYLRAFGTADNWPPSIQVAVAVKAYLSGRGFGPWPNTRRLCNL